MSLDTQPLRAQRAIHRRSRRRGLRWLLLTIIGLTSCALSITMLLLVGVLSDFEVGSAMTIALIDRGSLSRHQTRAQTVGELLNDIEVALPVDAALSHGLDEPLTDGMTIAITPAREVTLVIQGRAQVLRTALDNPLAILQRAEIDVSADDKIWVNGALARFEALPGWTIPARHIEIRRPRRLTVSSEDEEMNLSTTAETVGAALMQAGITLDTGDKLDPAADTLIERDMTVTIVRGIPVSLQVDGVVIDARSSAEHVDELLAELDIALFDRDFVIPPGDSAITPDMVIEIVRVTEEELSESEIIPFETRYEPDGELNLDRKQVVQLGQEGERVTRSRLRYENGVEVSREVIETVVAQDPRDMVVHYGTRHALGSVDTPQGPRQYWRVLCMYATSYHPAALGGDDRTSIGATLKKGIVAAYPEIIPYGTEVYVPGYGIGAMADTAGWRSSPYWIDLGYSDDDWVSWGKYVKVYLLTIPDSDKVDYLLPDWTPIRSRPASNCAA